MYGQIIKAVFYLFFLGEGNFTSFATNKDFREPHSLFRQEMDTNSCLVVDEKHVDGWVSIEKSLNLVSK